MDNERRAGVEEEDDFSQVEDFDPCDDPLMEYDADCGDAFDREMIEAEYDTDLYYGPDPEEGEDAETLPEFDDFEDDDDLPTLAQLDEAGFTLDDF